MNNKQPWSNNFMRKIALYIKAKIDKVLEKGKNIFLETQTRAKIWSLFQ